jgi:hypothetical protein
MLTKAPSAGWAMAKGGSKKTIAATQMPANLDNLELILFRLIFRMMRFYIKQE